MARNEPITTPANDIRPVANQKFLDENPAVAKLLEVARIPIEAIYEQNAKMEGGEDNKRDLQRHADQWIWQNRELFDSWIDQAKHAAG